MIATRPEAWPQSHSDAARCGGVSSDAARLDGAFWDAPRSKAMDRATREHRLTGRGIGRRGGGMFSGVCLGLAVLGCGESSTVVDGTGGASASGGAGTGGDPGGHGATGGMAHTGGLSGATGGAASGGAGGLATGGVGAGGELAGGGPGAGGAGSGGDGGSGWNGCDEFVLPADCTIPEGAVLPGELRCTGLYANWETRELRCGVTEYTPAHELWSDGAGKQRYVWLPPDTTIDVSDPDEFDYPVGTRFWKEFHVGPEGNQKLGETRLMLRAEAGWLYTVYVWDEAGTEAIQRNDGVEDLFGTGHTVPSREQCRTCHIGREHFILGWDFILLGEGAAGLTARDLADQGRLEGLDPAWLDTAVPGDDVERAALNYLHTNCGVSCHNTTPDATGNPSGLYLRLDLDTLESVLTTSAAGGINHVPGANAMFSDLPDQPELPYYDFRPLDPERSLVLARMQFRGSETAMPPIGTHVADPYGVETVRAWIESMTVERGYPAPGD